MRLRADYILGKKINKAEDIGKRSKIKHGGNKRLKRKTKKKKKRPYVICATI